jgi:hypothetical protein
MNHFAKIEDGIVTQVHCIKHSGSEGQAFCDKKGGTWVETSYTGAFRHNYAGRGYSYSADDDAFYPPQPYASWALDDDFQWQPPVPRPDVVVNPDGSLNLYNWNEESGEWVEIEMEGTSE